VRAETLNVLCDPNSLVTPFWPIFEPLNSQNPPYIQRQGEDLEQQLRDTLATPNIVVSLSGPSKSGKTVLVEGVVKDERLIVIFGSDIRKEDDLWQLVLDDIDSPETVADQSSTAKTDQEGTAVSLGINIPVLPINIGGQRTQGSTSTDVNVRTETRRRGGLTHVADVIGHSDYVVFIDDFHYIPQSLQTSIARQIKAASERGIRIAVALVPHRSDDVVRNNPELRGRVMHIDTVYWPASDLKKIALVGFPRLGITCTDSQALDFAHEACGSPQLMQQICLQACFEADVRSSQAVSRLLPSDDSFKRKVMERSALTTDYSSLVRAMHKGPKSRGVVRDVYDFIDGSRGDAYRGVLLGLAKSPPLLEIPYAELISRVDSVCKDYNILVQSITHACRQIAVIAREREKIQHVVEWDNNTLTILDPYFLFYLRNSNRLSQLAESA
jgi:hypothetical protein